MAAASEAAGLLLAAPRPPTLVVLAGRGGHRCGLGTHSTAGDGRVVCWSPSTSLRRAVDAEAVGTPVPPALARRWGSSDPDTVWPWWCATECLAKLTDTPVLLLARHGPVRASPLETPVGRMTWCIDVVDDLVVVRAVLSPTTS